MNHFSSIVGQAGALSLLQSSFDQGKISHAYLFSGPSGVGKMLTAVTFAWQLIAATDDDADIFWADQVHPDLMVIEIPANKTIITKEQITKEMEPWLALKPYRAKRRIVIVRDSHLISVEAANALLKTLEEPPLYAVIILVADQEDLLETITSRCQLVRFFPVADQVIEQYLLAEGASPSVACEVAKLAQGSVALARRFIQEEGLREKWQQAREMIDKLNSSDVGQVFTAAETIDTDTDLYTNMLETIIRDILIYKTTNKEDFVISLDNISLAASIKSNQLHGLKDAIKQINGLKKNYRRYVNSMLISVNIARSIWQAMH